MRRLFLIAALVLCGAVVLFAGKSQALIPEHDCSFCHSLHGASGSALLNDAFVESLCLSCHGPAGTSSLKADVHMNDSPTSYPAFRFTCNDCHETHSNRTNWLGGVNIELVGKSLDSTGRAKIATPNSGVLNTVFESRGTDENQPSLHSFADADEDGNGVYDGICEVCHTLTKHHRNDPSGGHRHNTGKTCTKCHEHVGNFIP